MSVESFDPTAVGASNSARVSPQTLAEAVRLSEGVSEAAQTVELSEADIAALAPHIKSDGWAEAASELADEQLIALVRLFTLGEQADLRWRADARSPVVPLVRALKKRGAWNGDLSRWVKSRTDNKFLPHGSLGDRL